MTFTFTCPKCNGRGTLTFCTHIENGRCFTCSGTGKVTQAKRGPVVGALEALPEAIRCTDKQMREITRLAIAHSTSEMRLAEAAGVVEAHGWDRWELQMSRKQASTIIEKARAGH